MENLFLRFTLKDETPIIICKNNIASISPNKNNDGSEILMNFARSKDLWPTKYIVKEKFLEIERNFRLNDPLDDFDIKDH